MLCNSHIVKMTVESAQMLSTTHRMLDGRETKKLSKSGKRMSRYYELPDSREDILYKAVHFNHPSTRWTMETSGNYSWHWNHFNALCKEYTHRYGKIHKTESLLLDVLKQHPNNIKKAPMTVMPLAMKSNPECMFPEDPKKSYRLFYQTKQHRFKMDWTRREIPYWFEKIVDI